MWKWFAAAAVILVINNIVLLYMQKRKRQQELEYVVSMIDRIGDTGDQGAMGCGAGTHFSELEDTELSRIVHQLTKMQERINGQKEEIGRDRNEVRRLIAEIAHQLRTPLANVETYLELLRGAEDEAERQVYMDAIEESEAKIHFLVESFIKMARLESRVIQIRKESMDLKKTIEMAVSRAERQAKEKGISLELLSISHDESRAGCSAQDDNWIHSVSHDESWLGEAIYNLLDNAVKYSPENSCVEICAEKSGMSVRIQVRDYGMGIEAGEETEIFKRFYRGKNVTVQEGYGLGLYLTREIVTRHDGFVRVKRMEKGSIFEICLPI